MKHLVIVKWNELVSDKKAMQDEVLALFNEAKNENPEIKDVRIVLNVVNNPNRYDCIFVVELDQKDLGVWVNCSQHVKWKEDYTKYLAGKAIFDME